MSAPFYTNPAYNPETWSLGYQGRQFGVAGPSVYEALANPPEAMTTAVENPEYAQGTTEPFPLYGVKKPTTPGESS